MNTNDKVVCLVDFERNLDPQFRIFHDQYPVKGQVYTIRAVNDSGVPNCPIKGVYLTGIQSKNNVNGQEQAWNSSGFMTLKDYRNFKSKFGGEYDYLENQD